MHATYMYFLITLYTIKLHAAILITISAILYFIAFVHVLKIAVIANVKIL